MGRKGGHKKDPNSTPGSQQRVSMTLREEASGKRQTNINAKTMCKLDHLKTIAEWAAVDASIPSLGAFFGQRLAGTTEALLLRSDPSSFVCQRCESILQPGNNCTVRVEKNKSKGRRRKKTTQNNVVYKCHFCSHHNLMRGTPKGHMKQICPSKAKPKPPTKSNTTKSVVEELMQLPKVDDVAITTMTSLKNLDTTLPATPLPAPPGLSLLDSKRKRKRSGMKKVAEPESTSTVTNAEASNTSTKRRKKTWTSLKEIAAKDTGNKFTNITVPFFI